MCNLVSDLTQQISNKVDEFLLNLPRGSPAWLVRDEIILNKNINNNQMCQENHHPITTTTSNESNNIQTYSVLEENNETITFPRALKMTARRRTTTRPQSKLPAWAYLLASSLCIMVCVAANRGSLSLAAELQQPGDVTNNKSPESRSTQASVDRQVSSPQQPPLTASVSPPAKLTLSSSVASSTNNNNNSPSSSSDSNPSSSSSKSTATLEKSSPKSATSASGKLQSASSSHQHNQLINNNNKDKDNKDKGSKWSLVAQQQNYDKYQLKASSHSQSSSHSSAASSSSSAGHQAANPLAASDSSSGDSSSASKDKGSPLSNGKSSISQQSSTLYNGDEKTSKGSTSTSGGASFSSAQKKSGYQANQQQAANKGKQSSQSSSFSLLKRILPSFMSSATAAAAAVAAVAGQSSSPNSRSSSGIGIVGSDATSSSVGASASGQMMGKISNKLIDYLASHSKKSGLFNINGAGMDSASGKSTPWVSSLSLRKSMHDRQAAPASGLASLLSNPLGLGLLFSAPLIPSLLLTPLALAGLSPAMSAINNLFNDEEDEKPAAASPSSPLASIFGNGVAGSGPLASILQNSGIGTASSGSGEASASNPQPSFAMQAMQSFLGPTTSTERPLFNPGMFASSGVVQNAIGSLASSSSNSGTSSSGSSSSGSLSSPSSSGGPIRSLFGGGNLMQAAASMISPTFAAPPSQASGSSSSSTTNSDDDDTSLLQMASNVFEKVSNYMNTDKSDVAQASGAGSSSHSQGSHSNTNQSPISTLVGLSSYSPFQLSSLFSSSPLASALLPSPAAQASGSSSSSAAAATVAGTQQRAGFFGTLKNIYELFSSSFLRRQEEGSMDASNECQQRLICELHQRAMNSKLFRRSIQGNLAELAQFDRVLQEQMKTNPQLMSARVDPDTKQLLNDFLKASNGFKQGRELVSCSKMFPKCSRSMLFSFANNHLSGAQALMSAATGGSITTDQSSQSKTIGKQFSNLMKKMKFKSNQQHQQQWKLRNNKQTITSTNNKQGIPVVPRVIPTPLINMNQQQQQTLTAPQMLMNQQPADQAMAASSQDYLQVSPLMPNQMGTGSQLNPVDSLKLAQQIMMFQQQQQQSQISPIQQQQQAPVYAATNPGYIQQSYITPQQSQHTQLPAYNNNQMSKQSHQLPMIYTDSMTQQQQPSGMMFSTDSPYFAPQQSSVMGSLPPIGNIDSNQQQQGNIYIRPGEQSQVQDQQQQTQQSHNQQSLINQQSQPQMKPVVAQQQQQQYTTRSGSSGVSPQQMTTPSLGHKQSAIAA